MLARGVEQLKGEAGPHAVAPLGGGGGVRGEGAGRSFSKGYGRGNTQGRVCGDRVISECVCSDWGV
jgi:hypothetical protein